MELRDLAAFATLGELLHFGQAAERMHVTQSALSKQIAELDDGAIFALDEKLGLKGKTKKEKWVKQAQDRLAKQA